MNRSLRIPIIAIISIVFFLSCQNHNSNEKLVGDHIDTTYPKLQFSQVNLPSPDTSGNEVDDLNLNAKEVKGYAAKYWERVLKHCMQSLLINSKDADYLGPSNSLGLGTITDENLEQTYRVLDSKTFSPEEIKQIIKEGSSTSCEYDISGNLDLKTLLNGKINVIDNDSINIGLNLALSHKRNVKFNVDKWQKDELIVGPLLDALRDTTNPGKNAYRKDMIKAGNIILTRVIRIKGFTADIELGSNLSSDLQSKISQGVIAKLGEGDGKVSVSIVNNRTLKIKSDDDFFVFGKFSQIIQ